MQEETFRFSPLPTACVFSKRTKNQLSSDNIGRPWSHDTSLSKLKKEQLLPIQNIRKHRFLLYEVVVDGGDGWLRPWQSGELTTLFIRSPPSSPPVHSLRSPLMPRAQQRRGKRKKTTLTRVQPVKGPFKVYQTVPSPSSGAVGLARLVVTLRQVDDGWKQAERNLFRSPCKHRFTSPTEITIGVFLFSLRSESGGRS